MLRAPALERSLEPLTASPRADRVVREDLEAAGDGPDEVIPPVQERSEVANEKLLVPMERVVFDANPDLDPPSAREASPFVRGT